MTVPEDPSALRFAATYPAGFAVVLDASPASANDGQILIVARGGYDGAENFLFRTDSDVEELWSDIPILIDIARSRVENGPREVEADDRRER